MRILILTSALLVVLVAAVGLQAQTHDTPKVVTGGSGMHLTRIANLQQPLEVLQPPGSKRLFVVQQGGQIHILGQKAPFLDLSQRVSCCGERGLLGLAFAPDYARSGLLYVDYTDQDGNTRIVEYKRSKDPLHADPASARTLLTVLQPQANHNGGQIAFGPDGYLYVALGDGGGQGDQHGPLGNAQNLNSLLGKILRIDPHPQPGSAYRIPADNPFVGRSGARDEIWAYGLRNPWRFSFDRIGRGMVITDVGASQLEEVNWAPTGSKGANYGWRVWEATQPNHPGQAAPGAIPPTLQYAHKGGRCSITGGFISRDPRIKSLYGRYLYADFCSGEIWAAKLKQGRLASTAALLPIRMGSPSSFGEDSKGRIYISSLQGGVYRLDP